MEEQENITFNEFKAFINGLIKGKKGQIPDFDDWVDIKQMMDLVEPEVREVPIVNPFAPQPYIQPEWNRPTFDPQPGFNPVWNSPVITCDTPTLTPSIDKSAVEVEWTKLPPHFNVETHLNGDFSTTSPSTIGCGPKFEVDLDALMITAEQLKKYSE